MAETTTTTAKPDAIRAPRSAGGTIERRIEFDAQCAQILGVPQVFVREHGSSYFVTGDSADSLNFPNDSAHPGQPRYRWEDQGEDLAFGYLIPESELPKPNAAAGNILLKLRAIQAQREAAARAGGAPAAASGGTAGA